MKTNLLLIKLFLIILFGFLISGCGTLSRYDNYLSIKANEILSIPYPVALYKDFTSLIFKVNADIYGRPLSGILVIKSEKGSLYKAVFMKEIGFKIFDIELDKNGTRVNYAMKPFNRKIFIKNIELKLRLLFESPHGVPTDISKNEGNDIMFKYAYGNSYNYYFYNNNVKSIELIENASKKYKKLKVEILKYENMPAEQLPKIIQMTDYNIKLKIKLELLQKDDIIFE